MLSKALILTVATLVAASATLVSCASRETAQLTFINIISVGGCPLSMYSPSDKGWGQAYLAPAFCVVQSVESLLRTATPITDPLTSTSYINVQVIISDSSMLSEALETMRLPHLEFLQLLSVQDTDGWEVPMTIVPRNDRRTATLGLRCGRPDCADFFAEAESLGLFNLVERLALKATVLLPDAGPVVLDKTRIIFMNQSRVLTPLISRSVRLPAACSGLKPFKTIRVSASCFVSILRNDKFKDDFAIEPTLCSNVTTRAKIDSSGRTRLILSFAVINDIAAGIIHKALLEEKPVSVEYFPVSGADVHFSSEIVKQSFKSLRLADNEVELELLCNTTHYCDFLKSANLWRHLSFTIKSFVNYRGVFCSWYSHVFGGYNTQPGSPGTTKSYLSDYHQTNDALLCIRPEFIDQLAIRSSETCATVCSNNAKCQAFSMASGSCQLFVFDRCSRNIVDCACTQRGRVFLKKQPGLEPGGLCPAGYGSNRCGFKYKTYNTRGNWEVGKSRCESERGLVTMSDAVDEAELRHIVSVKNSNRLSSIWLGGYQPVGSEEPAGGWKWTACETDIKSGLWAYGEPNDYGIRENVIEVGLFPSLQSKLNDFHHNASGISGFMCKCVSPFG